jgi:foldase protein PrsA
MRFPRSILALGAFFVSALAVAACGSSTPGNSVADVAGNPITTSAFNHWMFVAAKGSAAQSPGQPVIVPSDPPNFTGCITQARKEIPSLAKTPTATLRTDCGRLFTSLSSQVLGFLIKSYWYQADAAAAHIKITDAQVQQQFSKDRAQAYPTEAAFQSFLKSSGQTLQDILYRVRLNLIYTKLLKQHSSTVTPAQIQAYYNSHQSSFGTPESRNIRIILAKTQAQANAAKAALSSGQSWKAVAKKYSTDSTTKNNGGLLNGVTKGQEDAALDSAAFSAPANKLLGPVKAQLASGYYVFEVTKIKPPTQQTLAQATPQIQQLLSSQSRTTAQTAVDNQAKKRWQSKTNCRQYYVVAECSGYKTPSTSSTPATAPTTTG